MKINNIGYNHKHDSDFFVLRPNGSGDNLLLLLKTPAVFVLNGEEMQTEENSFILFSEGTPQDYRSNGGEFANDWFHFSFDKEETALFEALEIPFDKVVNIGDLSSLSLLIKNMCYENYSSNLYKTDSTELYLHLFLLSSARSCIPPRRYEFQAIMIKCRYCAQKFTVCRRMIGI